MTWLHRIKARPLPFLATVVLLVLLVEVCVGLALSIHDASLARQIAEDNRKTLLKFSQSPFVKVSLDSVFVGNNAPAAPGRRALYLHVCDPWGAYRSAIVSEDVTALVGRKVTTQLGFSQNLTPGLERFMLAKNPNAMTPKLFAASNWPRYTYIQYNTFLQAISGSSDAVEPMTTINLYIIDVGQPLPKLGDPVPQGPGPHDPPQPSCPISSATPATSQ